MTVNMLHSLSHSVHDLDAALQPAVFAPHVAHNARVYGETRGEPRSGVKEDVTPPEGVEKFLKCRCVYERSVNEESFHGIAGGRVVALGIQN